MPFLISLLCAGAFNEDNLAGDSRYTPYYAHDEGGLVTSVPILGIYCTVNTRYRHTRYRHSLVTGTKTRVYQLSPAKTSSLQALAHLVTCT